MTVSVLISNLNYTNGLDIETCHTAQKTKIFCGLHPTVML